jgi:hypothetical protein
MIQMSFFKVKDMELMLIIGWSKKEIVSIIEYEIEIYIYIYIYCFI